MPKRRIGTQKTSFLLRPDDAANLRAEASKLGYTHGSKPSISKLLQAIARGEIKLSLKVDKQTPPVYH
jgi:hypothetical protein